MTGTRWSRQMLSCLCLLALYLAPGARAELVAYWPLDEIADGRTPDRGPGGHHAVLHGLGAALPTVQKGIIRGALRFDAEKQQYLLPGPMPRLSKLDQFTAMVWIYPLRQRVHQEIFCQKRDHREGMSDSGWRLRYSWRSARFTFGIGANVFKIVGSKREAPPRHWSHVAGAFDGQRMRLYVNGSLLRSLEIDGEWRNSGLPLVIGNYVGTKKPYAFDGLLDELRIYDRTLTEHEIVRAAAEGLPR